MNQNLEAENLELKPKTSLSGALALAHREFE